ncbi:MAG TPA: class III extradiol ring-cleavage dioxygenase [Steroidobacteraceae bacterium]|nr:class III extradiol ring-cleavage dioxygenase [Steroidobacteraceae bacterium]
MFPSLYVPHGGGPCFFMEDPQGIWTGMSRFLASLPASLPERPQAILIVSGHWETRGFALTGAVQPPLVYDYYGFPAHTYQLRYDVPGAPVLAAHIAALLQRAGFAAQVDPVRGLDHGVFVPLKVAFPDATVPVVELSLDAGLDAALHLAAGRALAPLRAEGVLVMGAGMSFHNLRALGDPRLTVPSQQFDAWLDAAACAPAEQRASLLARWQEAPAARLAHPRPEHLLPLMVAAGASDQPGRRIYAEEVLGTMIAGFAFD